MNANGDLSNVKVVGTPIAFEDFEISWVGEFPSNGRVIFGSDDGRVRLTDKACNKILAPSILASPSREAVNEAALTDHLLAVSTRSDVTIFDLRQASDSREPATIFGPVDIYQGGAHGIVATSAGGFLAPLGPEGLLFINRDRRMNVLRPDDRPPNLYKLVRVAEDALEDIFVCTARTDGLSILKVGEDGISSARQLANPNFDFVDVCALGTSKWPRAAMALGANNSLHACRDVLDGRPPKAFQFNDISGKAYSLRSDRKNLFLLTSEGIYMFPNFVEPFLERDCVTSLSDSHFIPSHAVDIYLAHRKLMVVLATSVISIPIDQMVNMQSEDDFPKTLSPISPSHSDSISESKWTSAA